jgi:hypothetical protein
MYAQYVRWFNFSSYHSVFGAMALQTLCQAAEPHCLLPNITKLYWHTYDDTSFPLISHFLGPRTEQLTAMQPKIPSSQFFLARISRQYPSLIHVNFLDQGDRNSATRTVDVTSAAVCGWKKLRHLSVNSLSADGLCHAASLPFLKRLVLTNVRDTDSLLGESSLSQDAVCFPSLEVLSVASERITVCHELANMISSTSPLTAVSFMVQTPATSSQYHDLFNALKDHCNHSTVTSISIGFKGLSNEAPDTVLGHTHLQPFLVFSNLQHLKVKAGKFDLSDHGIKQMALAWPRIDTLLLFGRSVTGTPQVTLSGITSLAQCCPRLNQLGMAFDTRDLPVLDLQAGQGNALEELYVLNSPIVDPVPIAAFLRDIFPALHVLREGTLDTRIGDQVTEQAKLWMQVEERLAGLVTPSSLSSESSLA